MVVALLVAGLLTAGAARAAEKTDVVILDNGDRITGEIKGMSLGQLDFKTDDAGRFNIEWSKIARVRSVHEFEVELAAGEKYYGTLQALNDKKLEVVGGETIELEMIDIVTITPMDDYFWARVKASLDLGFTLAKSNSAMTLSGDGSFGYRGQHFGGVFTFNTYVQNDANSTAVGRASVQLVGNYYLTRWKLEVLSGADLNDELDLELRLYLGAGAAYAVLRNNWMELWFSSGLVGARELYSSGTPTLNLAAYFAVNWEVFRYDSPKLSAQVGVNFLPGLTDFGRFRGNPTAVVKYEVFYNFYLGLNFSFTYDTRPPDPTAPHTDYLMTFTVGWSYRN